MKEKIIYTRAQIEQVVDILCECMKTCHIFAFTGPLGAGKTTIINNLFRPLGVFDVISSPTFSYVNSYTTPDGMHLYHFDLYRITTIDEFCSLGFDEYLHKPRSYICIEWPEIIMPLLKSGVCHVDIEYHPDEDTRIATVSSDEKQ